MFQKILILMLLAEIGIAADKPILNPKPGEDTVIKVVPPAGSPALDVMRASGSDSKTAFPVGVTTVDGVAHSFTVPPGETHHQPNLDLPPGVTVTVEGELRTVGGITGAGSLLGSGSIVSLDPGDNSDSWNMSGSFATGVKTDDAPTVGRLVEVGKTVMHPNLDADAVTYTVDGELKVTGVLSGSFEGPGTISNMDPGENFDSWNMTGSFATGVLTDDTALVDRLVPEGQTLYHPQLKIAAGKTFTVEGTFYTVGLISGDGTIAGTGDLVALDPGQNGDDVTFSGDVTIEGTLFGGSPISVGDSLNYVGASDFDLQIGGTSALLLKSDLDVKITSGNLQVTNLFLGQEDDWGDEPGVFRSVDGGNPAPFDNFNHLVLQTLSGGIRNIYFGTSNGGAVTEKMRLEGDGDLILPNRIMIGEDVQPTLPLQVRGTDSDTYTDTNLPLSDAAIFVSNQHHATLNSYTSLGLQVSGGSGSSVAHLVAIEPAQAVSDFAIHLRNGSSTVESFYMSGQTGETQLEVPADGNCNGTLASGNVCADQDLSSNNCEAGSGGSTACSFVVQWIRVGNTVHATGTVFIQGGFAANTRHTWHLPAFGGDVATDGNCHGTGSADEDNDRALASAGVWITPRSDVTHPCTIHIKWGGTAAQDSIFFTLSYDITF